jgi:hypothetical protein
MLETASQMITNANNALDRHTTTWAKVQAYVHTFPGFMQGPVLAVLTPYEHRLRASYQWQLDCAYTLIASVNNMQTTDDGVSTAFTPRGFGRDHIS